LIVFKPFDQITELKVPFDKGFDIGLITTQQHDHTYIILYATELGRMGTYLLKVNTDKNLVGDNDITVYAISITIKGSIVLNIGLLGINHHEVP
jgi:hypothetical protein